MINNNPELDGIFQENSEGVMVRVFVLPRSTRCALAGIHDGALKVKLTKPPVDGEANAECCRFMAKLLGVPKSRIAVARGAASRHKALQISGLSAADARERLAEALSGINDPVI
jgi:uncharacterized protein (TIGR00251 family)